ncbi:MAG TPA: pentapeptide repeat-containing protein [Mucilaginibacter sp.]|jgi:uncharacterized protein YjbI with pentapeptide repeats
MENKENELVKITETGKVLNVTKACIDNSNFNDIRAIGVKIINANLSDLEIEGAQLGGAYIHNIGMPPKGHPFYDPNAKQRPLKFENCDLNNSTLVDCNLSGVIIDDCNLNGMKINDILVEDLLRAYKK